MKSWVVQTSFLGDAVLTLPFLYRLLEKGESVHLIAAPRNEVIFHRAKREGLSAWSSNFEISSWDKKLTKTPWALYGYSKNLKKESFLPERVYCIHRSFSTGMLALLSRAPQRVGFSSGAASFLYTHCASREWESGQSEIEKNLDLLRLFSTDVAPWSPTQAPALLGKRKSSPTQGLQKVAFSLGSPWATKEWDLAQARKLIERLLSEGVEVQLLGDKSFALKVGELTRGLESKLLVDYCGKTNLEEWIDLISEASVLVSGDSAAVHVASDLAVPVVALFGPTVTEFGFAPWRRHSKALSLEMPCRPCDIHGPRRCPLGHHKCMKDLGADWVYEALNQAAVKVF